MSTPPRILVLGPVELETDGRLIPVGGVRARSVLAALVIGLRHAVSDDHLIQAVWGDDPPRMATSSLQSHISRLRNLLGHDVLQRHDHSYILDFDPGRVDACEFERAYREAAEIATGDPSHALDACRAALQLWRGPPFG